MTSLMLAAVSATNTNSESSAQPLCRHLTAAFFCPTRPWFQEPGCWILVRVIDERGSGVCGREQVITCVVRQMGSCHLGTNRK
jgi:hypothetical protein